MELHPRSVLIYTNTRGRQPFSEWLDALKDSSSRAVIKARIARLETGNLGDCHSVGKGVWELRIHHGPGFRVYFGEQGEQLILLLCGGSKRTQPRDIRQAQVYWAEARETL